MSYLVFVFFMCLILTLVWVASNPSPYYGAAGLVSSAMVGCSILVGVGYSFISLVLFLIYLGGMLVVFVYTVSLAAEPHPEALGSQAGVYFLGYFFAFVLLGGGIIGGWDVVGLNLEVRTSSGMCLVSVDFIGVPLLYSWGGFDLLVCGWALLLVLFVVLELTRGLFRGGLRSV
uniref:NADH-ubiquinone oxidoreductase chain 6 n=1 Tax=Anguis colchica TaxID=672779 RepID=A0A6J3UDG0_9SAUR|nr:NADH dehydrogenase subunit 6 [Anguis colchica]API85426.1 NADH dehydrogenase subunit 6 [Anguis colchica]WBU94729.1 NADH dehydrogenase subunit 6 [Anguis colchica]WBU94755.1 NADH dehydrogenase subunit 6 [Anguis colchica]